MSAFDAEAPPWSVACRWGQLQQTRLPIRGHMLSCHDVGTRPAAVGPSRSIRVWYRWRWPFGHAIPRLPDVGATEQAAEHNTKRTRRKSPGIRTRVGIGDFSYYKIDTATEQFCISPLVCCRSQRRTPLVAGRWRPLSGRTAIPPSSECAGLGRRNMCLLRSTLQVEQVAIGSDQNPAVLA